MTHFTMAALASLWLAIVGCGSGPSSPHASTTPIQSPVATPSPVGMSPSPMAPTPATTGTPAPTPTLATGQWHLFELTSGIPVYSIDVDPGSREVLLAGTGDGLRSFGIFASRDGGRTWQSDGLIGAAVVSLQFDPAGSGDAFALAGNAVCHRAPRPSGEWSVPEGKDPTGPPYETARTLAVGPGGTLRVSAGGDVSVSRDAGETYAHVAIFPPIDGYECHNVHDVAIAPTDSSVVYVANVGGLVASTDAGMSWPRIDCPPTLSGRKWGIAVDPTSSMIAYSGTGSKIRKTADGGKTSTTFEVGGLDVSALVIDPVESSTIYAGTARGVRVSHDGGRSWSSLGTDFPAARIDDLAIDPVDGRTIYAATDAGVAVFVVP